MRTTEDTVNRICPVCGMDVDPIIRPVVVVDHERGHDATLRIGACSQACAESIEADPVFFIGAALTNRIGGTERL